uniref:SET domain-containing protein n=1 Tax=Chromera velia CCMP2878 TaxID=1169474 RepID=A0A0G4IB16_9ALVE|eukprot:Cvel_12745.t1-p1 / transcript=Cvel_12745.t1 / gene=Cvel_12745 / organism=Chromera_velia_CCMP2878 / gene_product=hypothetical protein / transcript_product=hypothetical protein / location=Cvel_scaffold847:9855-13128(+) / protein_length=723 / sequence_SO=supercontig / SO=protein_coding / is_pseudo=false
MNPSATSTFPPDTDTMTKSVSVSWESLKSEGTEKFKQGAFEEALALYEQSEALRVSEKRVSRVDAAKLASNRSTCLFKLERYEEAAAAAAEASVLFPEWDKPLYRQAQCHEILGDFETALKKAEACRAVTTSQDSIIKPDGEAAELHARVLAKLYDKSVSEGLAKDQGLVAVRLEGSTLCASRDVAPGEVLFVEKAEIFFPDPQKEETAKGGEEGEEENENGKASVSKQKFEWTKETAKAVLPPPEDFAEIQRACSAFGSISFETASGFPVSFEPETLEHAVRLARAQKDVFDPADFFTTDQADAFPLPEQVERTLVKASARFGVPSDRLLLAFKAVHVFEVASALFPLSRRAQHSCGPNAVMSPPRAVGEGGQMARVARAVERIKAGEAVTLNLFLPPSDDLRDFLHRRNFLAASRFIAKCGCRRCRGPDPFGAMRCPKCKEAESVPGLPVGDSEGSLEKGGKAQEGGGRRWVCAERLRCGHVMTEEQMEAAEGQERDVVVENYERFFRLVHGGLIRDGDPTMAMGLKQLLLQRLGAGHFLLREASELMVQSNAAAGAHQRAAVEAEMAVEGLEHCLRIRGGAEGSERWMGHRLGFALHEQGRFLLMASEDSARFESAQKGVKTEKVKVNGSTGEDAGKTEEGGDGKEKEEDKEKRLRKEGPRTRSERITQLSRARRILQRALLLVERAFGRCSCEASEVAVDLEKTARCLAKEEKESIRVA